MIEVLHCHGSGQLCRCHSKIKMWQHRFKNGVKRVSAYSVPYDLCPPDASLVWGFLVVCLEWVHAKAALD